MGQTITTIVEITFELVNTLPKDSRREAAKRKIRQAIREKVLNDTNAYYQDDEDASMTSVEIKEFGI